MVEPGQEAVALGLDDGYRETFTVGEWEALHLADVSIFGNDKMFEELMEVLRNLSILASSGPKLFGFVWQYFLSIFCALSR